MRVKEYVDLLRSADIHVSENTVKKDIVDLLRVLSDEELQALVRYAVMEGDDWLAREVTYELVRRRWSNEFG